MAEVGNGCDKKAPMKTLLSEPEKRFILWFVPKFPLWVTSRHLTLMTVDGLDMEIKGESLNS